MILRALLHNSPEPSDAHLWGRWLLRYALFNNYGISLIADDIAFNRWGKPYLWRYPHICFSISHSNNRIAFAVSDRVSVGIDVEKVRIYNNYAAAHAYSRDEIKAITSSYDPNKEFFRYWTLKESCIKAIGMGLSFPMKNITISHDAAGTVQSNMKHCGFLLLEDEDEYITSICFKRKYIKGAGADGKPY